MSDKERIAELEEKLEKFATNNDQLESDNATLRDRIEELEAELAFRDNREVETSDYVKLQAENAKLREEILWHKKQMQMLLNNDS